MTISFCGKTMFWPWLIRLWGQNQTEPTCETSVNHHPSISSFVNMTWYQGFQLTKKKTAMMRSLGRHKQVPDHLPHCWQISTEPKHGHYMAIGTSEALKAPFVGFLKWGYPQITNFKRVFPYKPSILGYPMVPLFMESSICGFPSQSFQHPAESSGTWNKLSGLQRWNTDQSLAYFTSAGLRTVEHGDGWSDLFTIEQRFGFRFYWAWCVIRGVKNFPHGCWRICRFSQVVIGSTPMFRQHTAW